MKLFGYTGEVLNEYGLQEISSLSIQGSPAELETFADFLKDAASQLELAESPNGHLHMETAVAGWRNGPEHPDIVVVQND